VRFHLRLQFRSYGGCDFSSHAGDIGINSKIDPESAVFGCCGADALEGAGIE
jgi:hypothetical protein